MATILKKKKKTGFIQANKSKVAVIESFIEKSEDHNEYSDRRSTDQ